jgi:serine/threonine-protein phosphatase 2B regulatory subunit
MPENILFSILPTNLLLALGFRRERDDLIGEEQMEEYRMLSGFAPSEIIDYYIYFEKHKGGSNKIARDAFLALKFIEQNPIQDRIADCFGFDTADAIDFDAFLSGCALFNAPGSREQKFRTAFRLHDYDDDGLISKSDLSTYINRITCDSLEEAEVLEMVNQVFLECSSDPKFESISYADFKIMVSPTDFHVKLQLPVLQNS